MEAVRCGKRKREAITLEIEYRGDLYKVVLIYDKNGGCGAVMNWGITFNIPAHEQDQDYIYRQIRGKDIFDEGCRVIGQVVMKTIFGDNEWGTNY